jgi:hypothetical protein
MKKNSVSRRTFLKSTGLAMTALSASRVFGANERVNVGVIGFGLIGQIHTKSFMDQSDVEIAAVSDAYAPRVDAGTALAGSRCQKYRDFRKLLENKTLMQSSSRRPIIGMR